jgi:hypothetical protein
MDRRTAGGAGKSTLAATYLEEAQLSGVWYQLDAGDSDPATFFYYLREAAQPFSGTRKVGPAKRMFSSAVRGARAEKPRDAGAPNCSERRRYAKMFCLQIERGVLDMQGCFNGP